MRSAGDASEAQKRKEIQDTFAQQYDEKTGTCCVAVLDALPYFLPVEDFTPWTDRSHDLDYLVDPDLPY